MTVTITPDPFDPALWPEALRASHAELVALAQRQPDPWSYTPSELRKARAAGRGLFPVPPLSPRASVTEIAGPRGPIPLRILRPEGAARGVFLHLHFGGWTLGAADMHDWLFEALADRAGVAIVSVDYRLAPEWPYPAGPDDCEAAAHWLIRQAPALFGTQRLVLGGESAGANLALVTALRFRDRHGALPFAGLVLNAGCYDLELTPSARAATSPAKLVLNRRDIAHFVRCYVPAGVPLRDPDVSPLYADLLGLPPCHVTIGTADPLVDDSLFLAARLTAARIPVDLGIYPGGCHAFFMFPGALTDAYLASLSRFLAG